jgi:hypothetical protein
MSAATSCYCTFEVPIVGYGSTISPKVVYCFFVAIQLDICCNKVFLSVINSFFFLFFKGLPHTFGKFLRVKHHDYLMLCGPYDNIIPVRLKYTDDPIPNVMFGKWWTSFCAANGIEGRDVLIFKCKCVMDKKYVILSKR